MSKTQRIFMELRDAGLLYEKKKPIAFTLKSNGFMDLSVERLGAPNLGKYELSMCHYGKQNGDMMRDPEVVLSIDHQAQKAIPYYFRNDYLGIEQDAHEEEDVLKARKLRNDIADFMLMWINNLRMQGFFNKETE